MGLTGCSWPTADIITPCLWDGDGQARTGCFHRLIRSPGKEGVGRWGGLPCDPEKTRPGVMARPVWCFLSVLTDGALSACGARFRQHDVDLEYLVVALLLERDLDVVLVDRDVLGDDGDQFFLQVGQEVLFAGLAVAFVGDDELQTLFGDGGGLRLVAEQEREQGHAIYLRTVA
jgi:hypothetical protein